MTDFTGAPVPAPRYGGSAASPAPTGFEFAVELGAKIGDLTSEIRAERQRDAQLSANRIPVDAPLGDSGSAPASGNLVLDLGTPPAGKVWLLRRIVVGAANISEAATGKGWVFVTSQPGTLIGLQTPTTEAVDVISALPAVLFYSNRQVVVKALSHVYVVINGGTSGQVITAYGSAESYNEAAYREVYSL